MKFTLALTATAFLLPAAVFAADPPPPKAGWSGSGEVGFAAASGNTRSENLNAKVNVKYNDDRWKNEFNLSALRNKGTVTVKTADTSTTPPTQVSTTSYQTTADRIEAAASAGYKLDDHSYLVGASRFERDEFSAYDHQAIGSVGYGYQVLKSPRNELAFEVGAGYKSVVTKTAANPLHVGTDSLDGGAARGKVEYKHSFNATTSFSNVYLVESTSGNTFVQNDAGLQVKMTNQLGLKAGYEIRHNSDVLPGFKSTDQLLTTNLVYSF
jgi:putative salt-induced outer membrane protein